MRNVANVTPPAHDSSSLFVSSSALCSSRAVEPGRYLPSNLRHQARFCIRSLLLAFVITIAHFCLGGTATAQAAACTGSGITGVTFRDYNANGLQDALEPGLSGIVVTAYDAANGVSSCESTADGTYGIDPVGSYPVRLEFTLPMDGSLNFLQPGAAGSISRTNVTFVSTPTANVNTGFSNPADFCGANPAPTLATSCFVFGEQNDNANGVNKDHSVMVTFPYTAGSTDLTNNAGVRSPLPSQLAVAKSIGSVWGLAWNPQAQTLYAAAFLKRHAGFGPSGPGAIYQITPSGPSLFYNFGLLAGADPHAQPGQSCPSGLNLRTDNANCWLHDANAFDQVGKMGFGDLDISDDLTTLYTINLANNTLLAIPLADPGAAVATAVPIPLNCPAVDVRPFGIGVKDGKVYVGMVCSAESNQNRAGLRAYVYAFAQGAFAATPALEIDLTYSRGSSNLQWQYWLNRTTFNRTNTIQAGGKWAQPWLTDIVFDGDDMVLGLRDRNADQFGSVAGGPDVRDSATYTAFSRGDILRACATDGGSWQLEANGVCGGLATAGAGNGQGPSGGEYYFQDQQADPPHSETSLGGHVQIPGLPDVVSLVYNPIEANDARSDGGVKWFNNQTGLTSRGYLIFDGSGEVALFDKANGLGDLEALCPAAPLEIGNRVWQDSDGDGVQDPGEPGLAGVRVELYRDGQLVGVTTTATGGDYLFNDSNVTQNGASGILASLCGPNGEATYEVRIPDATGGSQQPPLAGLNLTQAGTGGATNGDLRDSNGVLAGLNAIYAIPCRDLSAPGFNNHTYDFGFTPAAPVQTHSLGNYVWLDINNDGQVNLGEPAVPDGVLVELVDATGLPTGQTSLTSNGFYLFSGLNAGSYRVRLAASNFGVGAVLANYTSSTGSNQEANPDANGDQNDNGLDTGTPATDGIISALITLGTDEPSGETPVASGTPGADGQGTPDANSNLTVDFGVVPPPIELVAIGNLIFLDLNNNGRFEPASGETGVGNALVALFVAGADPLTATPLATTVTNADGFYLFDNLLPGQYFVHLQAVNFQPSGVLVNYLSSTGNGTSDSSDDTLDENGIDGVDLATNGVRSIAYDLQPNREPTAETGAGTYAGALDDDNVNLTADFGVYKPLSLGNRVWLDDGAGGGRANNGILDGAEQGIANVLLRLLDSAGNPVTDANGQPLTTTTDAQGYYIFTNLLPGMYTVLIDATNFAPSGPLQSLNSSEPTEVLPDGDGDLNDNGLNEQAPAINGIRSGLLTLNYDSEPIDESDLGPVGVSQPPDTNNLTVDFGFWAIPTALDETAEPARLRQLYLPAIRR